MLREAANALALLVEQHEGNQVVTEEKSCRARHVIQRRESRSQGFRGNAKRSSVSPRKAAN
jgi:hypothetical protein